MLQGIRGVPKTGLQVQSRLPGGDIQGVVMDWEMPLGTWGVGKEEQCPLLAPLRSPATPVTGTEEEDT